MSVEMVGQFDGWAAGEFYPADATSFIVAPHINLFFKQAETSEVLKWISVKERLPKQEYDEKIQAYVSPVVLALIRSGYDIVPYSVAMYDEKNGRWWELRQDDIGYTVRPIIFGAVTHWAELPPIPKEGENEIQIIGCDLAQGESETGQIKFSRADGTEVIAE